MELREVNMQAQGMMVISASGPWRPQSTQSPAQSASLQGTRAQAPADLSPGVWRHKNHGRNVTLRLEAWSPRLTAKERR